MHICHKWRPIASHLQVYTFGNKGDCTAILYACRKCPAFKVEKVNGHWSSDELNLGLMALEKVPRCFLGG